MQRDRSVINPFCGRSHTVQVWPRPKLLEAPHGPMQLKPRAATDNKTIQKGPCKGNRGPLRGTDGPVRGTEGSVTGTAGPFNRTKFLLIAPVPLTFVIVGIHADL